MIKKAVLFKLSAVLVLLLVFLSGCVSAASIKFQPLMPAPLNQSSFFCLSWDVHIYKIDNAVYPASAGRGGIEWLSPKPFWGNWYSIPSGSHALQVDWRDGYRDAELKPIVDFLPGHYYYLYATVVGNSVTFKVMDTTGYTSNGVRQEVESQIIAQLGTDGNSAVNLPGTLWVCANVEGDSTLEFLSETEFHYGDPIINVLTKNAGQVRAYQWDGEKITTLKGDPEEYTMRGGLLLVDSEQRVFYRRR
jgi:hypothetical protein